MKIVKFGTVIFKQGQGPLIEGWNVEREPEDPADATTEQLLLGFVVVWAKEKFEAALKSAQMDVFRKWAADQVAKKAAAKPN